MPAAGRLPLGAPPGLQRAFRLQGQFTRPRQVGTIGAEGPLPGLLGSAPSRWEVGEEEGSLASLVPFLTVTRCHSWACVLGQVHVAGSR